MIDFARPHENMYLPPPPPPSEPAPLDDFQVFKKYTASYTYDEYYSTPTYDPYLEPDVEAATNVYHNLLSPREFGPRDDWKNKYVSNWTEDDTLSWIVDTARCIGLSEYDLPFYNFKIPGIALRGMKREQVIEMLSHPTVDPLVSRRNGELVFDNLIQRLNEESPALRYVESVPYQRLDQPQTVLDLDLLDHRKRLLEEHAIRGYNHDDMTGSIPQMACDSSDDADDCFRPHDAGSPEYSGSDVSKSGDELEDKRKLVKRPPGRPKGSGRKIPKRPRSVSVPEFLRNLLLNPKYCPSIIKWEDYNRGMFRFVKPDDVAKIWGSLKQNENMSFEKFSRAMRYHYKQSVLVSVPTARLVYQFGPKGPDYKTDNPNFIKVKSEMNIDSEPLYS